MAGLGDFRLRTLNLSPCRLVCSFLPAPLRPKTPNHLPPCRFGWTFAAPPSPFLPMLLPLFPCSFLVPLVWRAWLTAKELSSCLPFFFLREPPRSLKCIITLSPSGMPVLWSAFSFSLPRAPAVTLFSPVSCSPTRPFCDPSLSRTRGLRLISFLFTTFGSMRSPYGSYIEQAGSSTCRVLYLPLF